MAQKIQKKIIIFDVDGVLIDSRLNMKNAWISVQEKFLLKKVKFNSYFDKIGLPFEEILKKLLIKSNHKKIKKCYEDSSIRNINLIKFYKGTLKELISLKNMNFKLCIVTSKDLKRTKIILKKYKKLFKFIQCPQKNLKGKPYPDQINNVIKKLKVKKKDCIYIGDTHIDFLTAKNAKIDFLFAKWGYGVNKNYQSIKNIKNIKKLIRYRYE